jgi:hypothetical protein
MDIKFSFRESDYSQEISSLLKNLGIDSSATNDTLNRIAHASFMEYFKMLSGETMPSKADEVKQLRLLMLSAYYANGILLSVQQISSMFHMTEVSANTLLNNTISRYRKDIEGNLRTTIKNILSSASVSDGKRIMVCTSPVFMQNMNWELSSFPTLSKVSKVKGSIGEISCSQDTYNRLCEIFQVEV